jgi:hypothetical protein
LLLLCIRILTIISIANLWEAWREWNEQSLRLVRASRAENLVAVFDQTDAAHREGADNIDQDGGREKRTHDAGNMLGLNVDGVQMRENSFDREGASLGAPRFQEWPCVIFCM